MTRRPAVTLIEVLVTMFIMAIGMLALLVLFPLGAVSMGQALKDDRCASTAAMAENVANAMNVRYDSNVVAAFGNSATTPKMVYVDPEATTNGYTAFLGGLIPRTPPSFATIPHLADRWFSLPDDITFLDGGTPDIFTTGGPIDRGRRYSYAYLLRLLPSGSTNLVQLYAVVYSGRPVNTLATTTTEWTYTASTGNPITPLPPNGLTIANTMATTIKRGGWIFDPVNGYFYRVTNITDSGGSTTVELQQNLIETPSVVVVLDNVAEVFDKGFGWQP
ncbi:MAG TPA: prepilin-type N-terminal cleavage/methylation domain-containing protein [Gemmataceae bacterium]|nr:prepilin-type N-terminal cleavage/methylation domain-containing protein [Gemmataceae bacterium]